MTATITEVEVHDVRFPTSERRDGSDAMHPDPDYSAAYVVLRTDDPGGLSGHGLCFTIGRGNEVAAAAVRAGQPVPVATGEHAANRVVFKLLQAGAVDFVQIDAARVAGVNENVAILLLAAEFGVPVCPHAGGVGLCELVQHLAVFDYVAVSGTMEGRIIEYVPHLHEHFTDPVVVDNGRYRAPRAPGFSSRMVPASVAAHRYPDGPVWTARLEALR